MEEAVEPKRENEKAGDYPVPRQIWCRVYRVLSAVMCSEKSAVCCVDLFSEKGKQGPNFPFNIYNEPPPNSMIHRRSSIHSKEQTPLHVRAYSNAEHLDALPQTQPAPFQANHRVLKGAVNDISKRTVESPPKQASLRARFPQITR